MCLCLVFIGLSLSACLLRVNVWLLCGIGISAYALMLPVTILFPSSPDSITLPTPADHSCAASMTAAFEFPSEETSLLECPSCNTSQPSTIRTVLDALKSNHHHNIELLTSIVYASQSSRLTLLAFFLLSLVAGIQIIFTQWASITYHWIIADVQVLFSFEMIVSGAILFSLPTLTSKYLTPRLESSSAVDMLVSKSSLMFLFMGLGLRGVAPTRVYYVLALTISTLGAPVVDSLRSFSTGLISEKEDVEKLYLGISMVETIGGMIATAVWSGLFSNILGKGWILERMPFWGCLLTIGGVWLVLRRLAKMERIGKTEFDDQAEVGDEEV